ncbi:VWA domain-containing protein [Nocardia wallacei]|uniref:VWA domain-containing protein n=1 Tax=Nocardia wallacei TaxID=480035 RepID=UPI00245632B4|nr:VWA domain-containing protein [Nocardia wallacei]
MPVPPLRVGIACDVSYSMSNYTADVASAAWIIAAAADQATMPADTATVTFGHAVLPVTYPGAAPKNVTDFAATDSTHAIDTAIEALDGALGLSRPENTRLLVIISDGHFERRTRQPGQQRLNRLRASGCAVLWLVPANSDVDPMTGATVHILADPAATAATIARAALTAVRNA